LLAASGTNSKASTDWLFTTCNHAPFCCWLYCLLLGAGFTIAPQLKVLHMQLNADSDEPGEGGEVAAMQLT